MLDVFGWIAKISEMLGALRSWWNERNKVRTELSEIVNAKIDTAVEIVRKPGFMSMRDTNKVLFLKSYYWLKVFESCLVGV